MEIVTGATGCIGNVLIKELLSEGKHVSAFVRQTSDTRCLDGCDYLKTAGDVLDLESLVRAFKGIENVYHLASEISILPGINRRLQDINIIGTRNVIKACFECRVKRLIYTSSIHALKEPENGIVINESMPFCPESKMGPYNRSKATASIEVMRAASEGLDTVIVCPTAVIGPYDFRISHIGQLIIDYCNGRFNITIDGAYDFVDVRDVCRGHILAAEKGKKGSYYLLSGQRTTIEELMILLEEITGIPRPKYKLPVNMARFFAFFTPVYHKIAKTKPRFTLYSINTVQGNSDISHQKATEELGYNPRPLKETLIDTIKWFRQQKIIK
jgi:dihydroflavonol-4-reductase